MIKIEGISDQKKKPDYKPTLWERIKNFFRGKK